MRETAAMKADRYLAEGRIVLTQVDGNKVYAIARGDGCWHHITIIGKSESCTCPARTRQCSHLIAVRRVTATQPEGANPWTN